MGVKRLAIFGDSYGSYYDVYKDSKPWPILLGAKLNSYLTGHWARGGSSHWYSFTKFREIFHQYDYIVFCHTNPARWPVLPDGYEGLAWNIGQIKDERLDGYNKIRKDIFSEDLLNYISLNIFKDVNDMCKENGIYLINIFGFPLDLELPNTEFPVLFDLGKISRAEKTRINGKERYTIHLNMIIEKELRECHLNTPNNIKLTNILFNLINNKTMNTCINLLDDHWEVYDDIMDKIYEKNLNNR